MIVSEHAHLAAFVLTGAGENSNCVKIALRTASAVESTAAKYNSTRRKRVSGTGHAFKGAASTTVLVVCGYGGDPFEIRRPLRNCTADERLRFVRTRTRLSESFANQRK